MSLAFTDAQQSSSTGLPLLEGLFLELHKISAALNESQIFADYGITLAEWAILVRTIGTDPVPLIDIVRATRLSRPRIRQLLKELEKKKLVQMREPLAGDRRLRLVESLPRAHEIVLGIRHNLEGLDISSNHIAAMRLTRDIRLLLRAVRTTRRKPTSPRLAEFARSDAVPAGDE